MFTENDAVIVVDYQNDFLPGGALGVEGGDKIVVAINRMLQASKLAVATRDWHPENHCSFGNPPEFKDGSWPTHCVADTPGSAINEKLDGRYVNKVINKGVEPGKEAYSGFDGTGLRSYLIENGIKRVFVCGLATDYYVKATALDALQAGFETVVVTDAIAAVTPETGKAALEEMTKAGIKLAESMDVITYG